MVLALELTTISVSRYRESENLLNFTSGPKGSGEGSYYDVIRTGPLGRNYVEREDPDR